MPRLFSLIALLLALLPTASSARRAATAGQAPPPDAEVVAFAAQLAALAKQGDAAAVGALSLKPAAFDWLQHGARGRGRSWSVSALELPAYVGAMPQPAVVFAGFHTVQSI